MTGDAAPGAPSFQGRGAGLRATRHRMLLTALVLGWTSGCTVLTPQVPPMAAPTTVATPSTLSTVATVDLVHSVSGRLNLRVRRASDGRIDGGSLLFEFEGSEPRGSLVLNTPIGTTVAQVRWDPEQAEVVTPQGRRTGRRLDEVAAALLGQPLPLAALLNWIRAEPWAGAPSTALADGFEQLGWRISLAAWHEGVVSAHRAADPADPGGVDITVRVRLDAPAQTPGSGNTPP